MTITSNSDYVWIYYIEDHFSKFYILFTITNEAITITQKIYQ